MELTPTSKREIPFNLTNISTTQSSTVSLFSFGSMTNGYDQITTAKRCTVSNSEFPNGFPLLIRYNYNGVLTNYNTASGLADIDALITELNSFFTENGQGIFWKEVRVAGVSWFLNVASNIYDFVSMQAPLRTFDDFDTSLISGTSIQFSSGTVVTYNQLATDLTNQPYVITTVYVGASNLSQAGSPFNINISDASGATRNKVFFPDISPNIAQSVVPEVPIYMPTSALNQLQYTLQASQSIQMIVRYEHIDVFDAGSLLQSGKFNEEMQRIRQEDVVEYNRIQSFIERIAMEQLQKNQSGLPPKPSELPSTYSAVPLLFVVKKENGDMAVRML